MDLEEFKIKSEKYIEVKKEKELGNIPEYDADYYLGNIVSFIENCPSDVWIQGTISKVSPFDFSPFYEDPTFRMSRDSYYYIRNAIEIMQKSYNHGFESAREYLTNKGYILNAYQRSHYNVTYYNLHKYNLSEHITVRDGGILRFCDTMKDFEKDKNIITYNYWITYERFDDFYDTIRSEYFDNILSSGEYNPDEALQKTLSYRRDCEFYRNIKNNE